ncbi:MAG: hypothetical protein IPM91_16215 [Bacteroidetes bacterium]|nr:hypothetical protein [Bacteroidota bacterium]
MRNDLEGSFFQDYLNQMQSIVTAQVYQNLTTDPSSDNYHYYRGTDYDNQRLGILDRYKRFSNAEGNSPTDNQSRKVIPQQPQPFLM